MNSRLLLETDVKYEKTQIRNLYFTAPYKVMSPFMDGKHMDVVQMSSSAGLLSGDTFDAEFYFGEGSDVTYLSQSYDKIFDTKDDMAKKKVTITLKESAKVKYMPYPVIPFANSNYLCTNHVFLDAYSCFLYCDIFTCGRTGMGEYYKMKRFESKTKIYINQQLDYVDHTLIDPAVFQYQSLGMWNHYTHNGMLYLYDRDFEKLKALIPQIQRIARGQSLRNGITTTNKALLIRTLGNRGEDMYQFYKKIADII